LSYSAVSFVITKNQAAKKQGENGIEVAARIIEKPVIGTDEDEGLFWLSISMTKGKIKEEAIRKSELL